MVRLWHWPSLGHLIHESHLKSSITDLGEGKPALEPQARPFSGPSGMYAPGEPGAGILYGLPGDSVVLVFMTFSEMGRGSQSFELRGGFTGL